MLKMLLAAAAIGGLTLTTVAASAAPVATVVHVVPSPSMVMHVDYWDHHHHWHHRRWDHGHWRFWD